METRKETGKTQEGGATRGKTHAEVLDEVVGPERRRANETAEEA